MGKEQDVDYRPLMSSSDEGIDEVEVLRPRWSLALNVSPWRKRAILAVFIVQTLLNIFLIGSGFYLYSRRGPSNPIFPQLTYCESRNRTSSGHT